MSALLYVMVGGLGDGELTSPIEEHVTTYLYIDQKYLRTNIHNSVDGRSVVIYRYDKLPIHDALAALVHQYHRPGDC